MDAIVAKCLLASLADTKVAIIVTVLAACETREHAIVAPELTAPFALVRVGWRVRPAIRACCIGRGCRADLGFGWWWRWRCLELEHLREGHRAQGVSVERARDAHSA